MVDRAWFFESGVVLNFFTVEPRGDGPRFRDLSVGISSWCSISDVVNLPFSGRESSVDEWLLESIDGSFVMLRKLFVRFPVTIEDLQFVVAVNVDSAIPLVLGRNLELHMNVCVTKMPFRDDMILIATVGWR